MRLAYALYHFCNLFLWSLILAGPFVNPSLVLILPLKITLDALALGFFSRRLGLTLNRAFFLWELLFPLYHLLAAPVFIRKKNNDWLDSKSE